MAHCLAPRAKSHVGKTALCLIRGKTKYTIFSFRGLDCRLQQRLSAEKDARSGDLAQDFEAKQQPGSEREKGTGEEQELFWVYSNL